MDGTYKRKRAESEEMETEWSSVVRETKVLRGSQGQGVRNIGLATQTIPINVMR
jgi:hypothetical protein